MSELANCPRCDALFVKGMRNVCHDCFKEEERAFQTVYSFLKQRKNRQASIPEIVAATGVEEEFILKFVKEQRLRTAQFPNLAYPCEKCGTQITEGRLCSNCSDQIVSDLQKQDEIDQISRQNEKEKQEAITYYKFKR